jgi:Ca2+-binding RTX toxin-like protein
VLSDSFETYARTPLQDGSTIGSNWEVAFLGYGSGGVSALTVQAITPATVLALPTSAQPTTSFLGGQKADKLTGTSGPDLIDGGGGGDTMSGGAGDDTYVVDNAKDVVVEGAGAGVDTVRTSLASYTLPANVENLQLTAAKGQKAMGNGLDNILTSNHGSATLNGGGGDDILISSGGKDVLTGGPGHDVFQFAALPAAAAQITDFTQGEDVLDLRALLTGYAGPDPVLDGWLKIAPDGNGGTLFSVDRDGPQTAFGFTPVADLLKVAGPLTMQTDWVFR